MRFEWKKIEEEWEGGNIREGDGLIFLFFNVDVIFFIFRMVWWEVFLLVVRLFICIEK